MDGPTQLPAWHQALAYAVTGRRYPELGRQEQPDVGVVATFLRSRTPEGHGSRAHLLPPELTEGVGAAQLAAAVTALRQLLDEGSARTLPVVADRTPTADELRLLREVPPHHG